MKANYFQYDDIYLQCSMQSISGTVANDNIFQFDYYKETLKGFKNNYYASNTRITLNNLCTSF